MLERLKEKYTPEQIAEFQKNKDLKLEIVDRKIDELIPYENNSRIHPPEQIEALAENIFVHGMLDPILVQNNVIVYGHGRMEAVKLLEWDTIPTIEVSHLTREQFIAVVLSNNQLADAAGYDDEIRKREIQILMESNYDLNILGLAESELAVLLDGWSSNIEIPNLQGDPANETFTIKIMGAKEYEEEIKELIGTLLDDNGYTDVEIK